MDSDSQGNGADSSKNSSRGRPLTPGEVAVARSSHPDIDTDSITIEYNWWYFLGGFTPHNTIHFPSRMEYCQDFSSFDGGNNFGWFIHEVTHAWRYQLGDSPFWGHIFSRDLFKSGDYHTFQQYRLLKSPAGLPAEEEADWYEWDALYGNRGGK